MLSFHLLVAQLSAAIFVSRTPEARDCPDTAQLVARVERIAGSQLTAAESASTALHADFSRAGNVYQANVQLTGSREGERVLRDESPTCEALADAVTVTTALLLDPTSRPASPVRAAGPTPPSLALWLSGRLGVGAGLVGGASWMAGAAIDVSLGPLTSVEIGGSVSGPHENRLGEGSVDVGLWFLEVGVFRSVTGEMFKFGPTLQVMGGALHASGAEYPVTSSASLAWWAVGAGARADVGLGSRLRLGARALAIVPARKQSFSVGYVGTAYESSSIAGLANLVLDVRVW